MRKIFSQFFGQIFFENIHNIEEKTLMQYYSYIRLNYREYPDLLLAVYSLLGRKHYQNQNKKLAHKFINKGTVIVKKIYTRQEIERFSTTIFEEMICVKGEHSPRAEIIEVKNIKSIKIESRFKNSTGNEIPVQEIVSDAYREIDPNNPNRMIIKQKIDW